MRERLWESILLSGDLVTWKSRSSRCCNTTLCTGGSSNISSCRQWILEEAVGDKSGHKIKIILRLKIWPLDSHTSNLKVCIEVSLQKQGFGKLREVLLQH